MPKDIATLQLKIDKSTKTTLSGSGFSTKNLAMSFGTDILKLETTPTAKGVAKIPKKYLDNPDDLVEIPFRAISSHRVALGEPRQTNFGESKAILRDARKMLLGKPVYTDHNTNTNNVRGKVTQVAWSPEKDGMPAGINALVSVNGKEGLGNEKLAQDLANGRISACSVTIEYEWKWSHPEMDNMTMLELLNLVGKKDEKGKYYERIATRVTNFHELSLVWLGADKSAVRIDEQGKPKKELMRNSLGFDLEETYIAGEKTYTGLELVQFSENINPEIIQVKHNFPTMSKTDNVFISLSAKFEEDTDYQLTTQEVESLQAFLPKTEADKDKTQEIESLQKSVKEKVGEIETFKVDIENANKKVESLETQIKAFEKQVSDLEETNDSYKNSQEGLQAELEAKEGIIKEYKAHLNLKDTEIVDLKKKATYSDAYIEELQLKAKTALETYRTNNSKKLTKEQSDAFITKAENIKNVSVDLLKEYLFMYGDSNRETFRSSVAPEKVGNPNGKPEDSQLGITPKVSTIQQRKNILSRIKTNRK